jgi:hypothetical protein
MCLLQELEGRIVSLRRDLEGRNGSWGWDEEGEEEMEHMTNSSPAIFGVPNHTPHPANNHNHKSNSGHQASMRVLQTFSPVINCYRQMGQCRHLFCTKPYFSQNLF